MENNWIKVEDRLPETDGNESVTCIVYSNYDGVVVRPFNGYHKCWDLEDGDDHYSEPIGGKVTHWMLAPEKPSA